MKEKKIFTSEIVAKNDESAKELERILKDEEIPFLRKLECLISLFSNLILAGLT